MFVYVEYISRRPGIPLENFQRLVRRAQSGWAGAYSGDRAIINVGRTWRVGPDPEYLTMWATEAAGLEHLSTWEDVFSKGEADEFQTPFDTVARIDRAGCFHSHRSIVKPTQSRHYLEFFEPVQGSAAGEIDQWFDERSAACGVALTAVLHRVGTLAPHRGIAAWAIDDYRQVHGLVPTDEAGPARVADAGLYANVGEEIH